MSDKDFEAKIVVLGAQGVGKTTLLHRFIHNAYLPPNSATSTIGASFLTKTLVSPDDSEARVRLQIWDTAGQERFRSISKLYYRGADAAVLCYDITSKESFVEMGGWLKELREMKGDQGGCVVHVVGTKSDVVAKEPERRKVPFESCIAYVAEHLQERAHSAPGAPASKLPKIQTDRQSGTWAHFSAWDCCHEVSAKDGEGVDEVFRVIMRKLLDERNRMEREREMEMARIPEAESIGGGYFDSHGGDGRGNFRIGATDKRRSWLAFASRPGSPEGADGTNDAGNGEERTRNGKCC